MYRHFVMACLIGAGTASAATLPNGFLERDSGVPNNRLFIAGGKYAQRVGSGVLVRAHMATATTGWTSSIQVLLACDGSWVSDPIQAAASTQPDFDVVKMERAAVVQETKPPLDMVDLNDISRSPLSFSTALSRIASGLCKEAQPEHRGAAIPVAGFSADAKSPAGTNSILVGTAKVKGNLVDVWLRTARYTTSPMLDESGKPYGGDDPAKQIIEKAATGAYSMMHTTFDCDNRTLSTTELIDYSGNGTVLSDTGARAKPTFTDVIPESVGEIELGAVCRIYRGSR